MSLCGLGQEELPTFFGRFIHWINVLDPTTFLASDAEIENSKNLLEHSGQTTKDSLEGEKVKEALKVCEASLHPDTGNIIPPIFRPPAFMPLATPLVVAALLPHKGTKSAFFWQILFQSYNAGFTLLNGRNTNNMEHVTSQQSLLLAGSVSYAACVGASPYFLMNRYKLTSPAMQTFFRKMLPVPLITFLSALNVLFVRMPEIEHGIEVRDKAGNIIGVSHHAGEKAVKETAVSRMALVGVTSLMPMLLHFVFQSSHFILRNPLALTPITNLTTALVFGAMIPVSFSIFPQHGKIQRDDIEAELQDKTTESELFYYRGL